MSVSPTEMAARSGSFPPDVSCARGTSSVGIAPRLLAPWLSPRPGWPVLRACFWGCSRSILPAVVVVMVAMNGGALFGVSPRSCHTVERLSMCLGLVERVAAACAVVCSPDQSVAVTTGRVCVCVCVRTRGASGLASWPACPRAGCVSAWMGRRQPLRVHQG